MNRFFLLSVLMVFVFASCSTDKDELYDGDKPGYVNGHAYVDLGLPSGLKWATMNVGATSVTDYGKYYAWGETKAYGEEDETNERNYSYAGSYTKTSYSMETYKWANDHSSSLSYTKYTLDPKDDAATQNWGGSWRMPTHTEQEELENECYWVRTSSYNGSGVAGYIVYAAKSSSDKGRVDDTNTLYIYSLSDPHIFLPAAGFCDRGAGSYGHYWSSSYRDRDYAWSISFNPDYRYNYYFYNYCYKGCSVRAVCE